MSPIRDGNSVMMRTFNATSTQGVGFFKVRGPNGATSNEKNMSSVRLREDGEPLTGVQRNQSRLAVESRRSTSQAPLLQDCLSNTHSKMGMREAREKLQEDLIEQKVNHIAARMDHCT